jgi:glycosyltransferase involved in cell wall biosynthesis
VTLAPAGPVAERIEAQGISVRSCEALGPADWRVFERLAALVQDRRPELVHALLFHANIASRAACLLSGFPLDRLVCEIQTVEIERRWHLIVDRWTHRWCRLIIGNSPSVIRHLHEQAGVPLSRLRFVAGGIDAAAVRAAAPYDRSALGVREDEALLLWAGRLDPVKGLDTLIGAVDEARSTRPMRLLIAGDGTEHSRLKQMIAERGLGDVVNLVGPRDDVHRLMRTADAFVFPSRTEGMPNALLEAMAAGLPVIATDAAGCRDLIADGQEGLLVRPDDPPALAESILTILGDPALAKTLSANAWHKVSAEYTVERCAARYDAVYAEVMARPSPM